MNAFTIRDLENLSGIKAHTIRIWEQRYNFLKPQRTTTNIRYYTGDELKKILNISLLSKYGFKISHINKMHELEIKEKILSLSHAQAQQERIVNEMIQSMVDLNMEHFEIVLTDYINEKGIDKTIHYIIFPFLERIGILWQTYHINPAQEHLVINVIRQKLIVAIEGLGLHENRTTSALLFLPEGEFHEIGLLYIFYLLKVRGIKVYYLGANVPIKDMEYIVKIKKPDFLFTHLTSVANNFNFERFLFNLNNYLPDDTVLISGVLAQQYKKKVPQNVQFKKSLEEVLEYFGSL